MIHCLLIKMSTTPHHLKSVHIPIVTSITLATAAAIGFNIYLRRKRSSQKHATNTKSYENLIGETPLVHLEKLSTLLGDGKNIFVKMESMNPGGTGKDRAALFMLLDAEAKGLLPNATFQSQRADNHTIPRIENDMYDDTRKNRELSDFSEQDQIQSIINIAIQRSQTGGIVVEGTSGSTGISLATLAARRGHSTIIVMPDDQSEEKQNILRCLGAVLHVVPTAAISNPNHYVNVAKKIADKINRLGGVTDSNRTVKAAFMNQFENEANYMAHFKTTGPEIWRQTNCKVDAFCMSSGTGGTISGAGQYLKEKCESLNKQCEVILIDPPGSSLFNKVKYNVAFATEQKERVLRRHRYDTIAEGIGLDRVTQNFALGFNNGIFDDAIRVNDQEAVDMAHWLLKEEGLFVGSSSAMNVYGAALHAKSSMGPNSSAVTVICDGGQRHLTRFWSRNFIKSRGLHWPEDDHVAWKSRLSHILIQQT